MSLATAVDTASGIAMPGHAQNSSQRAVPRPPLAFGVHAAAHTSPSQTALQGQIKAAMDDDPEDHAQAR